MFLVFHTNACKFSREQRLHFTDKCMKNIYVIYRAGGPYGKKIVPLVLSRPRAVLKTKGTVFSHTDRPSPVNNMFIFFFPAVNWFYRVLMVCLFTQLLSLNRLARRLLTICKNLIVATGE